jgi:hypothetical protein
MQADYRVLSRGLGSLLVAASKQITEGLPDGTSGSIRTQHFGLYYAVVVLTELNEPVTVKAISEHTGLAQPHVNTGLRRLSELGVLERRGETPKTGGKSKFVYSPRTDFEAMRAFSSES